MPETLTQLNEIWSSVLAKMAAKLSSQPDGKRMIDSFFNVFSNVFRSLVNLSSV